MELLQNAATVIHGGISFRGSTGSNNFCLFQEGRGGQLAGDTTEGGDLLKTSGKNGL